MCTLYSPSTWRGRGQVRWGECASWSSRVDLLPISPASIRRPAESRIHAPCLCVRGGGRRIEGERSRTDPWEHSERHVTLPEPANIPTTTASHRFPHYEPTTTTPHKRRTEHVKALEMLTTVRSAGLSDRKLLQYCKNCRQSTSG